MLYESVFRTSELPMEDRFEAWVQRMGRTHAPLDLFSDRAVGYRAHQRSIELGDVVVWPATFDPLVFRRTPGLIRRSDPEVYHLSLLLRGEAGATWDRQEANYRSHDIHINTSSRPYEICTGSDPVTIVGLEIPRTLVALPQSRADRAVGLPVSGQAGIGALLSQFITRVVSDTDAYHPQDAARLGTVACDLVTAVFAHALDADFLVLPETRSRNLVLCIKAFIRRHLEDPELTPERIAAAHHISRSHLYRLFQSEDRSVGAYIRDQRLEYARHDLADPALRAVPIHAIAARWGFPRPADFTRAFRALYGIAPSETRGT
ncbi:helix-turn-helix domain-containing protein [Streptomyces sp. CA-243310]|uniref:helix-turn-helix domain-containing protein n=1 Tax=Streptomyces sp. CA-243310 TaxID=3240056 RepID=UPI003D8EFC3C